jgi:hypothetical protein
MDDLKQLTDVSSIIVVASVSDAFPELLDEGRYVLTEYKLQVIEVIKGNMPETDSLDIPGGSYKFSDGSVVNQVEDAWKAIQVGKTYILFLSRWPDRPAKLQVSSAAQGIFEVAFGTWSLISYTYIQNDPIRDEARLGKAAFLEKVKAMVADAR